MNEGQTFFQALAGASPCAPLALWLALLLDWLLFIVGMTIAVAGGNFLAGELRKLFSWLLPVVWAAAARQSNPQPKEQKT